MYASNCVSLEGTFLNTDGSAPSWFAWSTSPVTEPNNRGSGGTTVPGGANCVMYDPNRGMKDRDCMDHYGTVCERGEWTL